MNQQQDPKDWTVIVYMSGDNNLSEECVWAIKEMYRVGIKGNVSVVAHFDSRVGGILRYDIGNVKGVNRVDKDGVKRDDTDGKLADRAVNERGNFDKIASREVLAKTAKSSIAENRANRYMVILSGHASGAVGNLLLSDNSPPSSLKISELRGALEDVKLHLKNEGKDKLDILGLDVCAMSMAEVGYELKDVVSYMVGAEGFELNTGWPYHRILEELIENSAALDPAQMAMTIVKRYVAYYSDYDVAGVSADLAACDLSHSDELAAAIRELAGALIYGLDDAYLNDQIILAHWRAQSYKFEEYTDLWDFCDQLEAHCGDDRAEEKRVKDACGRVKNLVEGAYVIETRYCGGAFQHSHGLSIYFPWARDAGAMAEYNELRFATDTSWGKFLEDYLKKTRRLHRTGDGEVVPFRPVDDAGQTIRFMIDTGKGPTARTGLMKNPPADFLKKRFEPGDDFQSF
jgi:hypothetical protein